MGTLGEAIERWTSPGVLADVDDNIKQGNLPKYE